MATSLMRAYLTPILGALSHQQSAFSLSALPGNGQSGRFHAGSPVVYFVFMAQETDLKAWQFERMKHALQALAAPAETQSRLFPKFTLAADELALDFDNFRATIISNYVQELGPQKVSVLGAIDRHLESADESVWSDEAIKGHPFWQRARELVSEALNTFEWPIEDPPSYMHEFVPG